jgi:threonine/homoserine/homoserine lactone efflux protein
LSWAILAVAGLSAIIATYSSVLIAIKIIGGLYLLWLAYKAFRSAAMSYDLEATGLEGGHRTPFGYAAQGFAIQMTNPKAALAWIAIVSLGLNVDSPLWVGAVIVIGTFVLSITIHVLYAIAFSTPVMVRIYGRARRIIQAVLGTFFIFAGLRLLTSRS